jgi:hypothetical protein
MLKIKRKVRIAMILVVSCCGFVFCVSAQMVDCNAFHNGVFHVYQSTTGAHYILYRDGKTEKEVVAGKGDSTIWNIEWKNDCEYTLEYVSGNVALTESQEKFLRKHKLYYHLQLAGPDKCLYIETIDKPFGTLIEKDTIRLHAVIADTGSHAMVYIYRPKKLTLSASSFNMYIDDKLVYVMKSNSGYAFTVFRQGTIRLRSQFARDTCSLPVDVELGKKYYVRSAMDWGFHRFKNYKLAMELVPEEQGKQEFGQVDRQ